MREWGTASGSVCVPRPFSFRDQVQGVRVLEPLNPLNSLNRCSACSTEESRKQPDDPETAGSLPIGASAPHRLTFVSIDDLRFFDGSVESSLRRTERSGFVRKDPGKSALRR